jgi:hypothetical protein
MPEKDNSQKKPQSDSNYALPGLSGSGAVSSVSGASGVDQVRRIQSMQAAMPVTNPDLAKLNVGPAFDINDPDFQTRGRTMNVMVDHFKKLSEKQKDFTQPVHSVTYEEKGIQQTAHAIDSAFNCKLPSPRQIANLRGGLMVDKLFQPKARGSFK